MPDPHTKLRAQIRAARELLLLKQSDLAEALGISLSKLSRVESGETKSGDILLEVKQGLEKLGIRFTNNGVERVQSRVEVIEGDGCYARLLDDVYQTLLCADDRTMFIMFSSDKASPPEVNYRYRLMRQNGISLKQLIEENDHYIMGDFEDYRTIPSKYFTNIVTVIYSTKVAQVNGPANLISILDDEQLAMREKGIFAYFWDLGKKPEISEAQEKF